MAPKDADRRDTGDGASAWNAPPLEVPRAGVATTETLARRQRAYRWIIRIVVVLFPVVALSLFVTAANLYDLTSEEPVSTAVDEQGRAVAIMAVQDWLDQDPPPLPGGRLVTWNGSYAVPLEEGADGQSTLRYTAHRLTVRGDPGTFIAQVLVRATASGQRSVVGSPSLEPITLFLAAAEDITPWPGTAAASTSDAVDAAVQAWLTAFTSGDPDQLRLAVGDPANNHRYLPISGSPRAGHTIRATASPVDADGEPTSDLLVQIDVEWTWPETDEAAEPALSTYDLLVRGADTGSPQVVAWGGAGSGSYLKPFQNAVVGQIGDEDQGAAGDDNSGGTEDTETIEGTSDQARATDGEAQR